MSRVLFALILALVLWPASVDAKKTSGISTETSGRVETDSNQYREVPNYLAFGAMPSEQATRTFGPERPMPDGTSGYLYRDRVLVPAEAASPALAEMLDRPIGSISMASLLPHRSYDAQQVAGIAGARHRFLSGDPTELERLFQRSRGDALVIVGHMEDGVLTLPGGGAAAPRVPIAELKRLSDLHKVRISVVSCKAGLLNGVTGPAEDIYTPEVLDRVRRLAEAQTFGDWYAAIGAPNLPAIVGSAQLDAAYFAVDVASTVEFPERSITISVETYAPCSDYSDDAACEARDH